jgi:hypothetical protein
MPGEFGQLRRFNRSEYLASLLSGAIRHIEGHRTVPGSDRGCPVPLAPTSQQPIAGAVAPAQSQRNEWGSLNGSDSFSSS